MAWKQIIGLPCTLPQLQNLISGMIFNSWRPSFLVLHNTSAPTLKQWHSADGKTRMTNLVSYFRDQRGWSAGPHAFVADDLVWPFTPFNTPGVHTPSWNGTSIGIETVGDFDFENPDTAPGQNVKNNAVALFAMLHSKLGINPDTIKLHKEDPRTTHECPGKLLAREKDAFIAAVHEYMGEGGDRDHSHNPIMPFSIAQPEEHHATVLIDGLNIRDKSSMAGVVVSKYNKGEKVVIFDRALNGKTIWLRTSLGWIAARFVDMGD